MDNIYNLFSDLLNKQNEFDEKVGKWLSDLERVEKVKSHRKQFHQWSPLRIYISLGEIKENPKFSLRFLGQEVGNIVVNKKDPWLHITQKHYDHNQKWFAPNKVDNFGLHPGKYKWTDKDATQFRKDFKEILENPKNLKSCIPEHRIEAAFIKEMESGKKREFAWKDDEIQPVKVADCPLQMPLPISASKGYPEPKTGHIDVLARHRSGKGKKVKLSVWELKSPGTLNHHAVEQVYIYALTLLYLLRRSSHGKEWYKLCGFKSNIPSKLDIEAVVAIPEKQKDACLKRYNCLFEENKNPLKIDNDQISFFLALYDEASLKIKSFQPMMGRERA